MALVLKRVACHRLLQRELLSQSVKKLAAVIRGEPRLSAEKTFVQHRSMTPTPDDGHRLKTRIFLLHGNCELLSPAALPVANRSCRRM
jgi:hypothetical protein